MTIGAILFDFGETLFKPLPQKFQIKNALILLAECGIEITLDCFLNLYENAVRRKDELNLGEFYLHREWVAAMVRLSLREHTDHLVASAVARYVENQRRAVIVHLKPRPDLSQTLVQIQQRGYPIGIVSNIDNDWIDPLVEAYGLTDWFDLILTSETAKSCKPDSKIFLDACRHLEVEPEACVFIGDSEYNDVQGARAIGMKTIRYLNPSATSNTQADESITNLTEIPDVLERFRLTSA